MGLALDTVAGPAWSLPGLEQTQGRFPLGVEAHVLRMVDMLVPGVTSATRLARYYSLHGLVWAEAERQKLNLEEALDLMRRCEVVLGGVSVLHDHEWSMSEPHGAEPIERHIARSGHLDVKSMSRPGGYVTGTWGFAGAYFGAERILGIIGPAASGEPPPPGPRCNEELLRDELGQIVEMAQNDLLQRAQLEEMRSLCACRAARSSDGAWLREVFLRPSPVEDLAQADDARRATARLLATAVDVDGKAPIHSMFRRVLAYGEPQDPGQPPEAAAWRGILLRNHSVSAWRRLWSWLVDQLDPDGTPRDQVADLMAGELPDISVEQFLEELPPTSSGSALLGPEENLLTQGRSVEATLKMLALGVRRLTELEGEALRAFAKDDDRALGPVWVKEQLDAAVDADRSLRQFARDLVDRLFDRAERIALQRTVLRQGVVHNPARIRERDNLLFRLSGEGWGDIGTRVGPLGQVLMGSGVFSESDGRWQVTDEGRALVG